MKMINIYKEFQIFFKDDILPLMKCISHHFDSENLNPFHLEGDVWTHTSLAFNYFLKLNLNLSDQEKINAAVAILCHDIGKCYTIRHNHAKKRTSFYNHAFASIQHTIDFCDYLGLENKNIRIILTVISNHMDFFDRSVKNKELLINNDPEILLIQQILFEADTYGSILEFGNYETNIDMCLDNSIKSSIDKDFTVYILSGVPGVGKDYVANNLNVEVLSFDNIRLEEYKKVYKNTWETLSEIELYRKAYKYVNDNKIDLLKILREQVKKCKEAGKNVAIANTNLTRKSRRALVNSLGKANYICLYVYAPTKIILMRNMLRASKQIPELVIKRFMRNQQIPTLKEGFDDVIFIRNY